MSFLDKVKNAFGYSHFWNKLIVENNLKVFIELTKNNSDNLSKIVSDFRTAHMNIIAWMIAFLWLINKDGVHNDVHFKHWVIALLIFIAISIVAILMSYYHDGFYLKTTINYLSKYIKITKQNKDEIIQLEFDKEKADQMKQVLAEFQAPTYPKIQIFINLLYFITWIVLIYGLYNIIMYYISML
jgi:hypothetical protein